MSHLSRALSICAVSAVSLSGVLTATTSSSLSASSQFLITQMGDDIDGAAIGDISGRSVSLSADGTRVAIGAEYNDDGGTNAGHVRVYRWNTSFSRWDKLGADIDGERAGDFFGTTVSLSGDGTRLAIGAPYNDDGGTNAGHVRVFDWNGAAWVQAGNDIDGEAANDSSGGTVSLSADGSHVAIGAPLNDGTSINAGHVRVYRWNNSSSRWDKLGADIDGERAGDFFGTRVSLSGDGTYVAIGAPPNDDGGTNAGHVRVYAWTSLLGWRQVGADIDGELARDRAGHAVSLSADGTRVAIGAPNDGPDGSNVGHVRVYRWNTSFSRWDKLGADIDGEVAGDASGTAVSLSADGSRVAIGSQKNDQNGTDSGHIRVFDWNGTSWVQIGSNLYGEATGDSAGAAVSLSADGSRVAFGAPNNSATGTASGHVRIFNIATIDNTPAIQETPINSTQAPLASPPTTAGYQAGNKKVTVWWNSDSWASSYVVTNSRGEQICSTTGLECEVTQLRNGKSYTYNVYSVNQDGIRSATATPVKVWAGFQVKRTTLKKSKSYNTFTIASGLSNRVVTWQPVSGSCRFRGTRLVASPKKGTCKVRLSVNAKRKSPAMQMTLTLRVR